MGHRIRFAWRCLSPATTSGAIDGIGAIGNNITNNGTIEANGGSLTLGGAVTNNASGRILLRKGIGTTYTPSDYDLWRTHFGQTTNSGTSTIGAVPEPAALSFIAIIGVMFAVGSKRPVRRRRPA